MSIKYTLEFKKEVVKEYATGRSYRDISETYNVPQATLAGWIKKYSEECQYEKLHTKEVLELKEFTHAIIHEFIDKIIIHQPDSPGKNRVQKVEIIYNNIGVFDLSALEQGQAV